MKVDHVSHISNDTQIRDTNDIAIQTRNHFSELKIQEGQGLIDVDRTPFKVKATVPGDGTAAFDIMHEGEPVTVNFC